MKLVFDKRAKQAVFYETQDIYAYREQDVDNLKFVGVLGCGCSGASKSVASLLSKARKPQISPSSTSPALSDTDLYPYFWRTIMPDTPLVRGMPSICRVLNTRLSYCRNFFWVIQDFRRLVLGCMDS